MSKCRCTQDFTCFECLSDMFTKNLNDELYNLSEPNILKIKKPEEIRKMFKVIKGGLNDNT